MPDYVYSFLTVAIDDGIARVEMNNPRQRNAFTEQMVRELKDAFREMEKDERVKAIILSGGEKCFSAGIDLNWFASFTDKNIEQNLPGAQAITGMFETIRHCSKPVIAEVAAAFNQDKAVPTAAGGGVGLTAVSDYAIADKDALFQVSEQRFGLRPSAIFPYLLPRMGKQSVMAAVARSGPLGAEEAHGCGLVDTVSDRMSLKAQAMALAQQARDKGKDWLKAQAMRDKTPLAASAEGPEPRAAAVIAEVDGRLSGVIPGSRQEMIGFIDRDLAQLFSDTGIQALVREFRLSRGAPRGSPGSPNPR